MAAMYSEATVLAALFDLGLQPTELNEWEQSVLDVATPDNREALLALAEETANPTLTTAATPLPAPIRSAEIKQRVTDDHDDTSPDFLLGTPRFTFTFRGGLESPQANSKAGESELWNALQDEFTADSKQFTAYPTVDLEFAYRKNEKTDLAFSLSFSHAEQKQHEYRHFVGTDDLPINQDSALNMGSFNFAFKRYFMDRGLAIPGSKFSWIPPVGPPMREPAWVSSGMN